jgi:hemerythrin superfamily protein
MDAISLTLQDHRHVESLFARYESLTGDGDQKLEIVREIIRELSVHAAIEEQFMYPAMKNRLPDGDSLVKEAIEEHQEAKEALNELDRMTPDEGGYDDKVRSLIRDVRHHVKEEEGELLPKLRASVSQERLEQMGEAMESGKRLAPTRPHPRAPSTPPGNILAGPAAAVADRVRDRLRESVREEPAQKPRRKPAQKKTATRKTATRKSTAKRAAANKSTSRKPTARKRTSRGPVYHVTSDPRGGWRATRSGSTRPLARSDSKQEVVSRARDSAKRQRGRLVIHKANGRIQEERTYGSDSRSRRG